MNGGPRFTRRHWGRECVDWALFPISFLFNKRGTIGPDGQVQRGPRELSMQRLILTIFVIQFARNFPAADGWSMGADWALGILTFALIVETLFAAVPVREGLAALVAMFGSFAARRTNPWGSGGSPWTPADLPGNAFVPHEWASGDPHEGVL